MKAPQKHRKSMSLNVNSIKTQQHECWGDIESTAFLVCFDGFLFVSSFPYPKVNCLSDFSHGDIINSSGTHCSFTQNFSFFYTNHFHFFTIPIHFSTQFFCFFPFYFILFLGTSICVYIYIYYNDSTDFSSIARVNIGIKNGFG